MTPAKKRETYLDNEKNINYIARYRMLKRLEREQENPGRTSQGNFHCQNDDCNETSMAVIPDLYCDEEILNDITPAADSAVTSLHDISSSDDECYEPHISHDDYTALEDLLRSPGFCDTITRPVNRSPVELPLMILRYSLGNKLPLTSTANLLQLLNSIFASPVIPDSRYLIDKLFNDKSRAEFHATCPECSMYIGKFGALDESQECSNCHTLTDVSQPSSGNYYAIIDPSDAMRIE